MSAGPPDWPEVSLGDICTFKYGKSLPAAHRADGPIPVFGSNGVVGLHNAALSNGPTIVVGRKGSFGEVALSEVACWPIDTTFFIDDSASEADLRWLAYRLAGMGLTQLNRAAAVPGLNRDDAYRLRLLLPPIDEQRRIADVLDIANSLRDKREIVRERVRALADAIFLDLFGDPISNAKGWPTGPLSSLGTLDRGVSRHRPRNAPHLLNGPYPFVQTGDVANCDGYIRAHSGTYSELGLEQSKMWPAGTLCITIAANIAKAGILTFDACFPDSVVGFSAASPHTVEYVRAWLSFVQKAIEERAPGFAQKNINLRILRALPVPVPPPALQRQFAERIAALQDVKAAQDRAHIELDGLVLSVQDRAFRGDL